MEVRPGYKQTEVGVIPEDWEVRTIGEIAEVKGGKRLPLGKSLSETETTHPYIRVVDMYSGGVYLDAIKYVPEDVFPAIKNYTISSADIFISVAGTLGIVGKIPDQIDGANLTENADKITNIQCDRDFLLYNLMSQRIQGTIEAEKTIGAQPKLALGRIRTFTVAIPPTLEEQRAIAAALSDVDALITALDRLIAKKRAIKQGAMQQLLTGQTRLPRFAKASAKYKQTEVGVIPEDWDVVQIDEVASVKTGPFGSSLHESDYVQDGTPIITVEHLGEFGIMHSNLPMVSDFDRNRLRAYSLQKHDIVFSRVGSVDRNALVSAQEDGWLFSGRLLRIRPKIEGVFSPYLSYHFHDEPFKQRVRSVAVGQTMPSLNTQIMKNVVVALPPLPEQRTIAAVLSDMDAEIAALEARRDKTRALKQGMMQELLTGRTRLV